MKFVLFLHFFQITISNIFHGKPNNIHFTHNMWPKAVNLLLIVLLSSSLTNGVRRKSKIDLPIANAADAPPNDNIALASSDDAPQSINFEEQPSAQALAATEKPVNSAASASALSAPSNSLPSSAAAGSSSLADNSVSSGENEAVECDPDMIGFEIITGYVSHERERESVQEKARVFLSFYSNDIEM